jgi:hypothetical protein
VEFFLKNHFSVLEMTSIDPAQSQSVESLVKKLILIFELAIRSVCSVAGRRNLFCSFGGIKVRLPANPASRSGHCCR